MEGIIIPEGPYRSKAGLVYPFPLSTLGSMPSGQRLAS
jgi:hypothetical protein